MPRSKPLRFDRRKGAWVEDTRSRLQELNDKSDDFHAGLIVGVGVGGFLFSLIMALAALTNLL